MYKVTSFLKLDHMQTDSGKLQTNFIKIQYTKQVQNDKTY